MNASPSTFEASGFKTGGISSGVYCSIGETTLTLCSLVSCLYLLARQLRTLDFVRLLLRSYTASRGTHITFHTTPAQAARRRHWTRPPLLNRGLGALPTSREGSPLLRQGVSRPVVRLSVRGPTSSASSSSTTETKDQGSTCLQISLHLLFV